MRFLSTGSLKTNSSKNMLNENELNYKQYTDTSPGHSHVFLNVIKTLQHHTKLFYGTSMYFFLLFRSFWGDIASFVCLDKMPLVHTSVCSVDSVHSSVHQKATSLLNLVGHYYRGPTLSEGSLMIVKLKTNFHSADQWYHIQQVYNRQ